MLRRNLSNAQLRNRARQPRRRDRQPRSYAKLRHNRDRLLHNSGKRLSRSKASLRRHSTRLHRNDRRRSIRRSREFSAPLCGGIGAASSFSRKARKGRGTQPEARKVLGGLHLEALVHGAIAALQLV